MAAALGLSNCRNTKLLSVTHLATNGAFWPPLNGSSGKAAARAPMSVPVSVLATVVRMAAGGLGDFAPGLCPKPPHAVSAAASVATSALERPRAILTAGPPFGVLTVQ